MRAKRARPDALVAEIAARQHGVIALEQLLWAGLSRSAVKRRVEAGHLHRIHRAVYAVGHANLTTEGHWMAAVLTCGKGACLGFESAGALFGMLPVPTCPPPSVDVVVPRYSGRSRRRGITIHYTATLTPRDVTRRKNIPVTSPARTRRDLGFGPEPTRSHLEREFLRLIRTAGVPMPEVNVRVGPYTVDCLWRDARLIVELDGYEHHRGRRSFTSDRARDRELKLRGYDVLRFSYDEVVGRPDTVVSSLIDHLSRASRIAPTGRSTRRG